MSYTLKNIDMSLSPESIDEAIEEIKKFRKELEDRLSELAEYLTSYGQEIARMQLVEMDAEFTGALMDEGILGYYDKDKHCGVIYTDKPYAMYVEFGTGYVGEMSPHHPLQGNGVGWVHDINEHGWQGWWYPAPWGWWIPKEGKHKGQPMAWTNGMPSRPFMYNTLRELEQIAEREGIEFFR